MDHIAEDYKLYLDTHMFLQNEELDSSWGFDEALSGYYDSSSPDGSGAWSSSSSASKNIVSERNRRKRLNERLFALRAVVPNISKMDKASIIKDAIDYIQELHEEERRIQSELSELVYWKPEKKPDSILDNHEYHNQASFLPSNALLRSKKKKLDHLRHRHYNSGSSYRDSPVEDIELRISYMGDKTMVVSLTCSKRRDTMVKLCEMFESLELKVITANITAFSGRLLKTLLVEADEEEKNDLKVKIEAAIATLNDPHSPMSI